MRRFALVSFAALALTACGQNAQKSAAPPPPAPSVAGAFPNLFQASFREEVTMTRNGQAVPIVIARDGRKTRLEFTADGVPQVVILDADSQTAVLVMEMGGQRMAIRTQSASIQDVSEQWRGGDGKTIHAIGPCSVVGEDGTEWEQQDDSGKTGSACVTPDGIILRATSNGQTVWEATRLQRGPQAAALFQPPPGVRVMDGGPGLAAALGQRMQGKKP
ncbi:MAG TPA: hypothetical protein VG841_15035 [Caulobacterales bacterium]|nr:hypothetical protein [Caulobacterales bacterium]